MLLKTIQALPRNVEVVAYLGDDISVHVWRNADGQWVLGIKAPKAVPIAIGESPKPIQVAKHR